MTAIQIKEAIKNSEEFNIEWEQPITFNKKKVPEIPEILLPKNLIDYATSLTKYAEVSSSMVVASVLGVLSTALCKKFVISPKDGWYEPINLYLMVGLPPASNKSLIVKNTTQPLIDWELEQNRKLELKRAENISKRKTQEKIIESMRATASKAKSSEEQEDIANKIAEKEKNLPEIPPLIKLFGNNFTTESLADDVYEQGEKFAIISDEGGVIETLSGLYTSGNANVDIVLKGIDGGDVRIRRKSYSYNINPHLTFLLVVQPQIFLNMASKKSFNGNGALERFLYFMPNSNLGYRTHETQPIQESLIKDYHSIITKMLEIDVSGKPIKLVLSEVAKKEWRNFQNSVEFQLRDEKKLENCRGWGGKISGFALRIAALIHVCETLGESNTISESAISKALNICSLLSEHAISSFEQISLEPNESDASKIAKWLGDKKEKYFSKSEILRAFKSKSMGKASRIDRALITLIERHYISEPQKINAEKSFKATNIYYINPKIYSL
jgi:hypothetical protein